MKRLYIFLLIVTINIALFGQNKVDKIFYVKNSPKDIIYIGIENPIEFINKSHSKLDLRFSIEHGTLRKTGEKYRITSGSKTQVKLKIYLYKKNDSILFCTQTFRTGYINDPVIFLNNKHIDFYKSITDFTKKELKTGIVRVLITDCENWTNVLRFETTSFNLEFSDKTILTAKDSSLTNEMINKIQTLKGSTKIILSDVEARAPDGSIRHLGGGYINIR